MNTLAWSGTRTAALALLVAALPEHCGLAFGADIPAAERRSGKSFMSRETQAMQADDSANPGMLWALDGEALWSAKAGQAALACADCHGDAHNSMKGVATRYPAFDAAQSRMLNLEQRINHCRTQRQRAPAYRYESRELLSLAAHVGRQSRGLPIEARIDGGSKPFFEAGRAAFNRRQGQLNLSCAQCHDERWDRSLAGNAITQAHPTGYPIYRLEWQGLGSLQRRLRNCMVGTRTQAPDYGDVELVNLELYLMWRAQGMALETPAVRP